MSASGWLFKKNSITMPGNMNVKMDICIPCHRVSTAGDPLLDITLRLLLLYKSKEHAVNRDRLH